MSETPPSCRATASIRTKVGPPGPAGSSAFERPIRCDHPDARMAPGIIGAKRFVSLMCAYRRAGYRSRPSLSAGRVLYFATDRARGAGHPAAHPPHDTSHTDAPTIGVVRPPPPDDCKLPGTRRRHSAVQRTGRSIRVGAGAAARRPARAGRRDGGRRAWSRARAGIGDKQPSARRKHAACKAPDFLTSSIELPTLGPVFKLSVRLWCESRTQGAGRLGRSSAFLLSRAASSRPPSFAPACQPPG